MAGSHLRCDGCPLAEEDEEDEDEEDEVLGMDAEETWLFDPFPGFR